MSNVFTFRDTFCPPTQFEIIVICKSFTCYIRCENVSVFTCLYLLQFPHDLAKYFRSGRVFRNRKSCFPKKHCSRQTLRLSKKTIPTNRNQPESPPFIF